MLSSRRVAQLGLFSASIILVGSVAVLVRGGTDSASPQPNDIANSVGDTSSNSIGTFQAQIPQPIVGKH